MTTEKQWVTVQELLREDVQAELDRRDGQWNAFREQVQWRLDREAGAVEQLGLEDRAIRAWADQVDGEVASVAHRFEGAFREELDGRIFERGIERPAWWRPWWDRARAAWFSRPAWGLAAAGAAAAVVLAVSGPDGSESTKPSASPAGPGRVHVEALAFDGSATVTVDDGVTLVMLASSE